MRERGFTLLEVLVATLIMGLAVVGLLSAISTSLRNAARVTDYDRVVLVAKAQMDALLMNRKIPWGAVVEGTFDPALIGGRESGWRARVTPFERPLGGGAGPSILERIELEVWWRNGNERKTFTMDSFRRRVLKAADIAALSHP